MGFGNTESFQTNSELHSTRRGCDFHTLISNRRRYQNGF